MLYASLKSIASYVPSTCVSNADFEKIIDTSDEWITKRTGIRTRHFATNTQHASDLAYEAGKLAMERAKVTPQDIDAVIIATLTPDYLAMPSTACITSYKLGIENKPAFDISAACSGFIYLLNIAKSFIESGTFRQILIIGVEKLSSVLDFTDRSTCVLFGDGAGACVIGTTEDKSASIVDVHLGANGRYQDFLCVPRTHTSFGHETQYVPSYVQMKGNETFKIAVKTLVADVEGILEKNKVAPKDVSFFIPHQANLRIINAVGENLNFTPEQIVISVHKYGNTSAASIPMAMNDVYEEKRLKYGDLMLLDAFGGGLTWGSALVHFGGDS
ncbi:MULTISPECIES: beta-ketoacyl-ACP synthase III [Helicobacter]|uniref:Beta-ketoacyl-[acyl-carrier-protein] synthase III n=1 Tax=Helicobacter typhlonius TaxID=76936 RepID=A0A099UEG9_9HELI|nr:MULTISPECIES: beta-ketoacyl-ACP synthase III [Helicobacter]TLD78236.1 ketoacyl-ACP synthase III [Helicobacter typhlonius]TLD86888.1 ketoacyl-ACP synthase III [Helicobacter sp. MIT 03-1616]CUU40721.1 3-oxoacyl-[acyl-carrier-protein] synthase, KASIII [Helicobacter typhlonius]HCD73206.1 ketoacyl-ACP synthase III [Helicobacter sp.]